VPRDAFPVCQSFDHRELVTYPTVHPELGSWLCVVQLVWRGRAPMIRAAAHPVLQRVATRLCCKRGSPDQVGRAWLRRLSVRGMSSAACSQVCADTPELPYPRQRMFALCIPLIVA